MPLPAIAPPRRCCVNNASSRSRAVPAQRGVVLIIALILLIVISLLAVTSMRSASSSESIAGNVRTTELATQAAEIALRHCESSAIKVAKNNSGDTSSSQGSYTTTITGANISPVGSVQWQSTTTWDSGTSTATLVLPSTLVGGTATYQRPPECTIELLTSASGATGATVVPPAAFIVTARGFGPEVPAGSGRPQGSVVWLQSTIELQ